MTSTQPEFPFREGDVLDYEPTDRWCHTGTAIVRPHGHDPHLQAVDTYWIADADVLSPGELRVATVRFNLREFDEVPLPTDLADYHPEDKQVLRNPNGRTRYFRRTGAAPDLATQLAHAEEALASADEAFDRAVHARDRAVVKVNDLRLRVRLAPPHVETPEPAGASA